MVLETSVEGLGRPHQQSYHVASRLWRPRVVLLLAISSFGMVSSAHTAPLHKEHKRDYKREIETVEEQWRTAQLSGDVGTMDKLLAEDYFGISMAGELNNKAQQLERLQQRTLVFTKLDISDVKIKLVGRVGIVTSLAQVEGTNEGSLIRGGFRYTRVYKRYPDGSWKITNFEVTRIPEKGDRRGGNS
jgi:ketosteroid isomerase-like protein